MNPVAINARFRTRPVTGVERFAHEVQRRLENESELIWSEIAPDRPSAGLRGHAWEQLVLPQRIDGGQCLFSPCNTGPVSVRNQMVVIHDAAVWDCPEGFSKAFRHFYRRLLPALARRCRQVATVSEFSRRRLAPRLGIPEEQIAVLGNAVDGSFSPLGDQKDRVNGDSIELLCVGSLDPRKNLARLVRAWLDLKTCGRLPENARLTLVGGANPRNFADFERAEDVSIQWLGRVSDEELIECYRSADAFVFPSLYEGFGLPPLEAMACGSPVLMSRAASLPEVGGAGFEPADPSSAGAAIYFDPLSEKEIGNAILEFLELDSDQRQKMATNARARAAQFTWDEVAAKTLECLKEMN